DLAAGVYPWIWPIDPATKQQLGGDLARIFEVIGVARAQRDLQCRGGLPIHLTEDGLRRDVDQVLAGKIVMPLVVHRADRVRIDIDALPTFIAKRTIDRGNNVGDWIR